MKTSGVFVLALMACAHAQLRPNTIIDFVRRGAILTYNVDATKCDVKMPDQMPTYSFGEVMNDLYIEFGSVQEWSLYSTTERPVNSSRFNIQNGAWRVTEVELTPSGPDDANAFITITDIEQGPDNKVLATGNLTCNFSSGGFDMRAQRMGGGELARESDVMEAFKTGAEMSFVVDLSTCAKQGDRYSRPEGQEPVAPADGNEYWAGRISGYRVPKNSPSDSLEFTSILMGPKQHEVFNVNVREENQVTVKAYSLSRPSHQPTPVVTYTCRLGLQGGFHVFRV